MVFTTEWFLDVAIESQVEQNLSPLPVNSVRTQGKFFKVTPVSPFFSGLRFHFDHYLRHSLHLTHSMRLRGNNMNKVE